MPRLVITDTSFYQGYVNHAMMHAAGADATIVRSGSANKFSLLPYTDFRFHETAASAVLEMASSAYWYLRLGGNLVEQMRYFADLWKTHPFHFEPVLDVEEALYPNGYVIPPGIAQANLKIAVDELERLTGHWAILYSRTSFFKPYIGYAPWMSNHKLWIARYVFKEHRDDVLAQCQQMEPGALPQPWEKTEGTDQDDLWWGWQCSADENRLGAKYGVESHAIDLSLAKTGKDIFYANLIRPFTPKPDEGEPEPMIPDPVVFYRVINDGQRTYINIRDNHAVNASDRGNVPVETVFPAFAEWKIAKRFNGKPEHWVLTRHPANDLAGWVAVEWNGWQLCEQIK